MPVPNQKKLVCKKSKSEKEGGILRKKSVINRILRIVLFYEEDQ
jgi:hypothetical protein